MTFSLRLSNEDSILIKKYAAVHNLTVSELVRQSVMERIENEYDLDAFRKAMEEYRDNPQTYSLEEMERELGL
ncbi:MAG: CopG family transcriptional regulator [Clostridia bacterium]|nr:CopG family transcriptional regulator [Clostridia bacterium]